MHNQINPAARFVPAVFCMQANKAGTPVKKKIDMMDEDDLLDQFTIANTSYRTDEYGRSLEIRLRFPCEIVQAIKAKGGSDFPVADNPANVLKAIWDACDSARAV